MRETPARIPLADYPAQGIAIIKPSALGDIVHALPVLSALRRRYPAAYIAWVVNQQYEPLLADHPDLDETIPFDRGVARSNPWRAAQVYHRFFRRLRAADFDLAIDLQGLFRSGLMSWMTRARRRIGLATAREGSRWFYTDIVDVANLSQLHAVERYLQVLRPLGADNQPIEFRLPIDKEALLWAKETLKEYPRPWICFGVGARWETKRWPAEHFAALARQAQQEYGGTVIFVGRADDAAVVRSAARDLCCITRNTNFVAGFARIQPSRPPNHLNSGESSYESENRLNSGESSYESQIGAQIKPYGPYCDLMGKTTLPQLIAVLSLVDVMVANDTGPLHLAAALGRPVIAPYTCTKIALHGPYGNAENAVAATVPCQGSYLKRCPHMQCMRELTPDRLWPLLSEVLLSWQRKPQHV